jgi:hypothetical protein
MQRGEQLWSPFYFALVRLTAVVHNASSEVIKPCEARVGRVDDSSHLKTRVRVTRQNIIKTTSQSYASWQHCM